MPTFEAGVPISSIPGASGTFQLATSSALLTPPPSGVGGGAGVSAGDAGSVIPAFKLITGTEGDDLLPIAGGFIFGGAGADSFLLTPVSSRFEALSDFGVILDFQSADKLDLSALGADAKILGSEPVLDGGGQRVSIDFDGDGVEDGFLFTHAAVTIGEAVANLLPSANAFAEPGPAVSTLSSLLPADAVPSAVGTFELREATAEDIGVVPTALSLSADWIFVG